MTADLDTRRGSPEVEARRKWLKLKTRQLIKACGGLELASEVCELECRSYSAAQLSRCQNPALPDVLPLDILDCLEAHCGERIVSRALSAQPGRAGSVADLRDEASDVTEAAAELQKHVRAALSDDGEIDPREAEVLLALVQRAKGELADVEASLAVLTRRLG